MTGILGVIAACVVSVLLVVAVIHLAAPPGQHSNPDGAATTVASLTTSPAETPRGDGAGRHRRPPDAEPRNGATR